MLNEKMIMKLEDAGFKRWTKGDYDRLYIDATACGLECDTYKSGNISSATFNGESISNARAGRMKAMKMYVDIATGEFHAEHAYGAKGDTEIAAAAEAIYTAIVEAAEAEEAEQKVEEAEEMTEEERHSALYTIKEGTEMYEDYAKLGAQYLKGAIKHGYEINPVEYHPFTAEQKDNFAYLQASYRKIGLAELVEMLKDPFYAPREDEILEAICQALGLMDRWEDKDFCCEDIIETAEAKLNSK
jgi:hypothetical protein